MANAAIILAAGASERMGSPKQLLPWGKYNLLQKVVQEVRSANFETIIVVVGANYEKIVPTLPQTVIVALNQDWESGMGSSIACGMISLQQLQLEIKSVMIILADQPLINAEYFKELLRLFSEKEERIIATDYYGRAGVPALFGRHYFEQLAMLNATYGAKELLSKNREDCILMHAGKKTIDIDTKEEYINLNNKIN